METPTTEIEGPARGKIKLVTSAEETMNLSAARGKIKLVTSAEETMNLSEIRKSVNELVALHERKKLAAEAYKDSIEAIATKGGVSKKALNAYVVARAKGELPKAHAAANQLVLLFEGI